MLVLYRSPGFTQLLAVVPVVSVRMSFLSPGARHTQDAHSAGGETSWSAECILSGPAAELETELRGPRNK